MMAGFTTVIARSRKRRGNLGLLALFPGLLRTTRNDGNGRCPQVFLFFILLSFLLPTTYALHASHLNHAWQTYNQYPVKRRFIVNMPIARSDEWFFLNKQKALAGELFMVIAHKYNQQRVTIFKHGKLMPGWHQTHFGSKAPKNGLYFQFYSDHAYLSSPQDSLKIVFNAVDDLVGQDAYFTGILKKGRYETDGDYSGLTDNPDIRDSRLSELLNDMALTTANKQQILASFKHRAFCSNWQQVWPVKIINGHGWLLAQ